MLSQTNLYYIWLVVSTPFFTIASAVLDQHSVSTCKECTSSRSSMIVSLDFSVIHEKLLCIGCKFVRQHCSNLVGVMVNRKGVHSLTQHQIEPVGIDFRFRGLECSILLLADKGLMGPPVVVTSSSTAQGQQASSHLAQSHQQQCGGLAPLSPRMCIDRSSPLSRSSDAAGAWWRGGTKCL